MNATTHQGKRPTKHQEEHEMTATMKADRAELTRQRAALHKLIDKASLPALRFTAAAARVAVLSYDTPGGNQILRRENEEWLSRHPSPDEATAKKPARKQARARISHADGRALEPIARADYTATPGPVARAEYPAAPAGASTR